MAGALRTVEKAGDIHVESLHCSFFQSRGLRFVMSDSLCICPVLRLES